MTSAGTGATDSTVPSREVVREFASLGVLAFTTTRTHGDFALGPGGDAPAGVAQWVALQGSLAPQATGLVSAAQVHGTKLAVHAAPWDGWRRLEGFDAHVVRAPSGAAAVTVADCVPVFVAHASGVVAIVHAGWRGTAGRVLARVIARLEEDGLAPGDLHLHLGPAICGRCYEVGPDVYEQLTGWQTIRNRNVDLRALLAEQAKEGGVRRITASAYCTRCDNDRFFSHRAGDSGRQVAVILAGAG